MSVESMKHPSEQPLMLLSFELWGKKVVMAALHRDEALWLLSGHHLFGSGWFSPEVRVIPHGWDIGPDAEDRRMGVKSRVLIIKSKPLVVTPPPPEKALFGGEADDRLRDLERD